MENPWLIQRAKIRKENNTNRKGIDQLLDFDYMGSAEFEWGALPESLKRIRASIKDYIFTNMSFNGKPFNVLCKFSEQKKLSEILDKLSLNEFPLKEYCDFAYSTGKKTSSIFQTEDLNHFWWDIVNDWMVWIDDKKFTKKFLKTMGKIKIDLSKTREQGGLDDENKKRNNSYCM